MESEPKARNLDEKIKEMLPFIVYAAIPLLITISIAFIFGVR